MSFLLVASEMEVRFPLDTERVTILDSATDLVPSGRFGEPGFIRGAIVDGDLCILLCGEARRPAMTLELLGFGIKTAQRQHQPGPDMRGGCLP